MAESTLPAFGTDALKGVHAVNAGPSVGAGVPHAVVDVCRKQARGHFSFADGKDGRGGGEHVRAAAHPGQLCLTESQM